MLTARYLVCYFRFWSVLEAPALKSFHTEVVKIVVFLQSGKFVFMEHIDCGDNIAMHLLQVVLERMWSFAHNNCRLTRRVIGNINSAGFRQVHVDQFLANELIRPTPLFASIALAIPHMAGVATK